MKRTEMADAAFEVAAATRACAKAARNGDLAARVDFSRSELLASRDTESATRCDEIHAAAAGALAALADYGVTAATLAALQARIAAYRAVLTKPREALATGKTATARLAAEFRATDALLADRLDNLVPQFRSAGRVFVADYQNARRIVQAAASRDPQKPAAPATGT